jgi:Ankyrin repeats (3 copies)
MCEALLTACVHNITEWNSEDEASKDALEILNGKIEFNLNTCVSRDEYGWTPLSYAISSGLKKVVEKLIEKGATINHQDKRGVTPFMRALAWNQCEIALFLKEKGADLKKTDNDKKTTDTYVKESTCTSLKKPSWFGGRRKTKSTRRRRSKTKATRKR